MKIFEIVNRGIRSAESPKADLVIFNHIAKTAGGCMFRLIHPDLTGESPPKDIQFAPHIDYDLTTPTKEMCARHIQLVWGDYTYGYHAAIGLTATYATVLRDPVERFVSEYFWIANNPGSEFIGRPDLVMQEMARDVDRLDNANYQTYELCAYNYVRPLPRWSHVLSFEPGKQRFNDEFMARYSVPVALEQARSCIARDFSFVGISELVAESILLMADLYGWRHVAQSGDPLARVNHASIRPAVSEIPVAVRRKLEKISEADRALYDECRLKIERDFAAADFGPTYNDLKSHLGLAEVSSSPYFTPAADLLHRKKAGADSETLNNIIRLQQQQIERLEKSMNDLFIEKIKREMAANS